jgi:hypothetical protein
MPWSERVREMTANSIQEGGCTPPPPLPRQLTQSVDVLPVLAALSPVGATGLVWLAAILAGPGIDSLSWILRFSLVVWGSPHAIAGGHTSRKE